MAFYVTDVIGITQEFPTIRFNSKESVEMPFRKPNQLRWRSPWLVDLFGCCIGYIKSSSGEPCLPPGMKELLKQDLDKGFDF